MLGRIVQEKIGDFSVMFENVQMHKNFTLSMKSTTSCIRNSPYVERHLLPRVYKFYRN